MTPWTTVHQASLSMGFFQVRILEWVAISSSRGDLPYPGTEPISPASPALAGAFFITVPPGKHHYIPSVQFSSVAQSCLTLCNPMNRSMAGLPVHHQLLEFTQTHVPRVSDAIQPSHPLSSPSPPAPKSLPASESFPMSQLFPWGGQSTGVSALASFLPKKSHT